MSFKRRLQRKGKIALTHFNNKHGLEFDFTRVTAAEMYAELKSAEAGDVPAVAAFLAKVVTKCSEKWGPPNEPDTYLNLPFYGEYQDCMVALHVGIERARKGILTG